MLCGLVFFHALHNIADKKKCKDYMKSLSGARGFEFNQQLCLTRLRKHDANVGSCTETINRQRADNLGIKCPILISDYCGRKQIRSVVM